MTVLMLEQLKRAFSNRWFFVALLVGVFLALWSAWGCYGIDVRDRPFVENTLDHAFPQSVLSAYRYWIVNDVSQSASALFFLLLPLLSCMPYAWSYLQEMNSGYASQVIVRADRVKYFASKAVATAVSGGVVVSVPLVVNFIVNAGYAPLATPEIEGAVTFGMFGYSLWSWDFYNLPWLYCIKRLGLIFAFCALWTTSVMCLSLWIRRPFVLLVLPYVGLLALAVVNINVLTHFFPEDLTPFSYLKTLPTSGFLTNGWIILAEYVLMLLFVAVVACRVKRADVL